MSKWVEECNFLCWCHHRFGTGLSSSIICGLSLPLTCVTVHGSEGWKAILEGPPGKGGGSGYGAKLRSPVGQETKELNDQGLQVKEVVFMGWGVPHGKRSECPHLWEDQQVICIWGFQWWFHLSVQLVPDIIMHNNHIVLAKNADTWASLEKDSEPEGSDQIPNVCSRIVN